MSRPDSFDHDSRYPSEKPKRRLSLRLQPHAGPEKRIKSDTEGSGSLRAVRRSRSKDSDGTLNEPGPSTRSCQESRHSQQSQQSNESDDDDRPESTSVDRRNPYRHSHRDKQHLGDTSHSSSSTSGERGTVGSRWVTDQGPSNRNSQSSSSRSSRSSSQRQYNVKSDGTERQPSPAAMTLSSGQPLVNPPLKTQAAFVGKLYSMLEDNEIAKSGLIHWSAGGLTFTCPNPTDFSR